MEPEDAEIMAETLQAIANLSPTERATAERCATILRQMVADFGQPACLAIMLVNLEEAVMMLENERHGLPDGH